MRYASRTCILKAVIQYCEQCLYTGQLKGRQKIVSKVHQIYFRPFWLTLGHALALIKYVLGVG